MISPFVTIAVRSDGQKGLFALASIDPGDILLTYNGPLIDHATRWSIQIDATTHIEGTDTSNAYLNHSCAPNAYVDWDARCLRALHPIRAGEEITCNYLTTDAELHEPFVCTCGAPECFGEIRGFAHLTREQQEKLAPWASPFLRAQVRK